MKYVKRILFLFYICRRRNLDEVPTDTDEACTQWLYKMYMEKVSQSYLIILWIALYFETIL